MTNKEMKNLIEKNFNEIVDCMLEVEAEFKNLCCDYYVLIDEEGEVRYIPEDGVVYDDEKIVIGLDAWYKKELPEDFPTREKIEDENEELEREEIEKIFDDQIYDYIEENNEQYKADWREDEETYLKQRLEEIEEYEDEE